jgi:hypothetical protein
MIIKFDYYKRTTGKWYTNAELDIGDVLLHEAFKKAGEVLDGNEWPGLVKGCREFHVVVSVPFEDSQLTHLYMKGTV